MMEHAKFVAGLIIVGLMLFCAGFAWGLHMSRPRVVCDITGGVCLRAMPGGGGCSAPLRVRWVRE